MSITYYIKRPIRIQRCSYILHLILICISAIICTHEAHGQSTPRQNRDFFSPADTFNQKRFNTALAIGGLTYVGSSYALYKAWYDQYPQDQFHFFNDWDEWGNMDKYGHIYSSYFQSRLCYTGAKWTGLNENQAILTGLLCGMLFQSTIEVMDGFSTNWGFSWSDFTANTIGVSSFVIQQKYFQDQFLQFKVSSYPDHHPDHLVISNSGDTQTLSGRADDLFGSSGPERFLKDYNKQTIWASVNVNRLIPGEDKVPKWLNLAIGIGAENLYGGFENSWTRNQNNFILDESLFPRYHQFYLSLDVDLTKINTDHSFLKTILSIFNLLKVPAPAIEYNTRGEFIFHFIHF